MQDANALNQQKKVGQFMVWGSIILMFIFPLDFIGIGLMFLIIGILVRTTANKELEKLSGNHFSSPINIANSNAFAAVMPNNNFNGVWDTEWGEIMLVQNGIDVSGTFIGANLNGQVSGRKFFFDWEKEDDNLSGRGVLAIENGFLVGSWGHDRSNNDGGPIKGIPQKDEPKLVVNEPEKVSLVEETGTSEIPVAQIEDKELDKIEQIKQATQDKKEEMSEQIKEKVEEFEEKVPEEIKVTESFQELKSSVEETIETLDEKADEAIEEVMVESTEQIEQVQEKIILSLEDSLSKLNDTLERLDKAVMSKDRENIISELAGSQMDLNLTIDRIDNTIGYGIEESLRGGKTIVGNIEGIPHPVSIKVPKSMNDFASGLKKGQKIEQKVTLSSFNSIRKMLEFVIN
ncbi:MAG: hypothetical protein VX613_02360 [Candidatus Thermoplasmatota archaeon]|nr:hypothetical protein [Candidatus Thermoplasmatota archaeon]